MFVILDFLCSIYNSGLHRAEIAQVRDNRRQRQQVRKRRYNGGQRRRVRLGRLEESRHVCVRGDEAQCAVISQLDEDVLYFQVAVADAEFPQLCK